MAKTSVIDDIHDNVSSRLEEVQTSLANHRKNSVALHKLHVQASKVVQGDVLVGEAKFEETFLDMINRVLVVKKGQTAERVVRFVGAYVKHLNTKGASLREICIRAANKCREQLQKRMRKRAYLAKILWLLDLLRGFSTGS